MTHTYPTGGLRRAAVFAVIIGLHWSVLLLVLNDQLPQFRGMVPESGPITLLPPKPEAPLLVPPEKVLPPEALGQVVEQPVFTIPDFLPDEGAGDDSTAAGQTQDGVSHAPGAFVDRTPASLQGLGSDFAAVVRACYPAAERRTGDEGLLNLAVTISASGQVRSWRQVESTGFPRLDAAAPCVLGKLRFNAAREDGRPVQSEVILPIVFRLY